MKHKYIKRTIGALLLGGVFLGASVMSYVTSSPEAYITFKDFTEGTRVNYQVIADGKTLETNSQVIGENGLLSVPLSGDLKNHNDVGIDLNIATSADEANNQSAQDLNLLLSLNKKNGDVSLKGKGLSEFSDMTLKRGGAEHKLTSDWAGLLSSDIKSSPDMNSQIAEPMQLAFQNAGLGGDFNPLGGSVEVLLGDSSGSNLNAVRSRYNRAIRMATEELSAVMVMQTQIVGMFMDASIQMDTQRKHQELMARAHKDYHPSEMMCRVGTFMRSVAHTEFKSEVNKHALNRVLMNQYMSMKDSSAEGGPNVHEPIKLANYKTHYCDPRDSGGSVSGMNCPNVGAIDVRNEKRNQDIDFSRSVGTKLTLDVDFSEDGANTITEDERYVVAMAKHLYFPRTFASPSQENVLKDARGHYDSRSFAAKMNVAHSSFLHIVGMKSSAPPGQQRTAAAVSATNPATPPYGSVPSVNAPRTDPPAIDEDAGWAYMKALLREFGIENNASGTIEEQIDEILGVRPSYYAQMEVLTKKIYQSPNFYTNLYDKPANVKRIGASLDAIMLMNQRDRFESLLRREMLSSVLVEDALKGSVEELNARIFEEMQKPQFEE